VLFPPDEPPVLAAEDLPRDHALRSLLCSAGDESCGRETAGWALRAGDAFRAHGLAGAPLAAAPGREALAERCRREAMAVNEDLRYARWYGCVAAGLPRDAVLPLGRVRAPARGWLVLRGRRGHYHFCDEARAYDLATGAAWIATSCGGLVLQNGGSVDFDATDRNRAGSVVTGVLPIDALREAVWMLLLADQVEVVRRQAELVPLPRGLEPRLPSDGSIFGSVADSMWFTSAQTTLAWSWIDGGRVRAEGTLVWPSSYRAAETHAASLVRTAEAALAPGCPPAALPRAFDAAFDAASSHGGVSSLDADPVGRTRVSDRLADRLRRHRPACPTRR
jgi:hypothetical protein